MAADPQEVFGAVTWSAPANGNADGTRCQRRTALCLSTAEKYGQNPLLGRVCLLTTGGLIRVRCSTSAGTVKTYRSRHQGAVCLRLSSVALALVRALHQRGSRVRALESS